MEALARVGFGLFGLAVLVGIAFAFSNNKRAVDWRLVLVGVTLQIAFASLVLLVPGGREVFDALGRGFVKLLEFTAVGTQLVFGDLARSDKFGFIFAFQVLPTIIFFAALMGVLYHLGVMQWIVRGMAWAITKVMRVSGAETTSVCASIFIGQTEAPLTIRPYIGRMTQSELLTIMVGGLIGQKIVLNEFIAYLQLSDILHGKVPGVVLTAQGQLIATYALCGFANFSSIAIQMAVTGGLAPNQRPVIARLGIRALLAGSLANLMSAALAGLLI